jgi:hypothetical protein
LKTRLSCAITEALKAQTSTAANIGSCLMQKYLPCADEGPS